VVDRIFDYFLMAVGAFVAWGTTAALGVVVIELLLWPLGWGFPYDFALGVIVTCGAVGVVYALGRHRRIRRGEMALG
jgi:hypothetical protein